MTRPMRNTVADATKRNRGARAVSAVPRLDGDHPVATVSLLEGDEWKTVSVRLDAAR